MILPLFLCRRFRRVCHIGEHILNENAIPRGGIVDHHVGHCADQAPVLNDGAARQECGQVGTTNFIKKYFLSVSFFLYTVRKTGEFLFQALHIYALP